MSGKQDTGTIDYAPGVAVTAGVPFTGMALPLFGAMGACAHCYLVGGAAGALVMQATNFDAGYIPLNGVIPWQQVASDTLAANGQKIQAFSVSATGETNARYMRWVFTPSANGTLYIATNIRRLAL